MSARASLSHPWSRGGWAGSFLRFDTGSALLGHDTESESPTLLGDFFSTQTGQTAGSTGRSPSVLIFSTQRTLRNLRKLELTSVFILNILTGPLPSVLSVLTFLGVGGG